MKCSARPLSCSLGANREHGQRLTTPDKQNAAIMALQQWPSKRSREIAQQIGCAYIRKVKRQVSTGAHLTDRVAPGSSDGKSYPAARIQAAPSAARVPAASHEQKQRTTKRVITLAGNGLSTPADRQSNRIGVRPNCILRRTRRFTAGSPSARRLRLP
jgi:hypothetical protein